jgi:Transposase DDE domain
MHRNKKQCLAEHVRRFRARFVQSVDTVLTDVIPEQTFVQWVIEEAGIYRERIYSPLATLALFIEQVLGADHSCQDAVARGLSARVALGQPPSSLNTGPYCKARQRLPISLLTRLAREVGARLCAGQPTAWRWRGREVKLIDGTTVSMPDTSANQARFPQSRSQKPGLGFPLARLVAIVSLSAGAVLDWAIDACEGKKTGETALLWRLMPRLQCGDVVIADGYYAGYFMIAGLVAQGVDIVMPQHHLRLTDFRRGQRLGVRDHVATWIRPQCPDWMDEATYSTMPEILTVREVRAGGRTLITTLTDARATSKQALAELYALRWHVELDLRAIKTVMQMDILRCKTPAMVEKEIAAHLLAYNLVRAVMAQAAVSANLLLRQLSFKAALQLLNAFEMNLRHCPRQHLALRQASLIVGIASCQLPHRPGRVEPRVVKRRPKQHWLLTKPRRVLRARLLKLQERRVAAALR